MIDPNRRRISLPLKIANWRSRFVPRIAARISRPYAPGLHHSRLRVADNESVDGAAGILRASPETDPALGYARYYAASPIPTYSALYHKFPLGRNGSARSGIQRNDYSSGETVLNSKLIPRRILTAIEASVLQRLRRTLDDLVHQLVAQHGRERHQSRAAQ